jgi:2-iminobutanoate/2-iminopropanoate deaminase
MKETIVTRKGPSPADPYPQGVVANGFVFVSGQDPTDPETNIVPDAFTDQVRQALRNVRTILEAAGSNIDNVVKVNAYITDLTRFSKFNEVYKEFFLHDPPARTTVATGVLGSLVEIDCIATLPKDERFRK